MSLLATLSGCKKISDNPQGPTPTGSKNISKEATDITKAEDVPGSVKYSSITEVFDWGPSVTKVILDLGVTLDAGTLSKKSFQVSLVKEYPLPGSTDPVSKREICSVSSVYVSDEAGNEAANGTYVTINLVEKPSTNTPLYSEGMLFKYAKISFVVSEAKGADLKTKEGQSFKMAPTNQDGFSGNQILKADVFDKSGTYTDKDITLHYASYIPSSAATEKESNPLIIWLHGAGEGGTDPLVTITGNKVVNLADKTIQSYFGKTGAYILAPQAPTMWMDYNGTAIYNNEVPNSDGKSYYTQALKGLIDDFISKHPEIDKKRIYLGGCSNGGYMTMNMIINYPDYFAAAFPICEAYSAEWLSKERVNKIVNIPIWFTHAKNDPVVKIYEGDKKLDDFANAAYDRLVKAGAKNIHYSLYDNVVDTSGKYFAQDNTSPYEYLGHFSWIYTLNDLCSDKINGKEVKLFAWLAEQKR